MSLTKKLFLPAICAAVILMLSSHAFAANLTDYEVRKVNIAPGSVTLQVDQERTLRASANPRRATDTFTWSSSVPDVVSVDSKGVIKGIKPGFARVTVTSSNGQSATSSVQVTERVVRANNIQMAVENVTLRVNQEKILIADVFPYDALNKSIKWESSNPAVVTVDDDGVIVGISPGTAEITAFARSGRTAVSRVTVSPSLSGQEVRLGQGEMLNTSTLRQDVENSAKAKENENSKQITLTYTEKTRVSTAALRTAATIAANHSKQAVLRFCTLDEAGSVQGQLTIHPQNVGNNDMDIQLGVYTSIDITRSARQTAGHLGDSVAVIHLAHEGAFPTGTQLAARLDLGYSEGAIKFYRYDNGSYTPYGDVGYRIDVNRYIHFTVYHGGTYVLVVDSE